MPAASSYDVLEYSSIPCQPHGLNLDGCFVHSRSLAALYDCESLLAHDPSAQARALDLAIDLRHALLSADAGRDPHGLIEHLSYCVQQRNRERADTAPVPWASLAVYNAARREIILVGECFARVDETTFGKVSPARCAQQQARRAALRQLREEGATDREMLLLPRPEDHPGLKSRLNASDSVLACSAINGDAVPPCLVTVIQVPLDVRAIALATRGYPYVGETLEESELVLRDMMQTDPLGIDTALTDDGWRLGTNGYADRTYLRLAT